MKKLLLTALLICCSVILSADDASDVLNLIMQGAKDAFELKIKESLTVYADDCKLIDSDGSTFTGRQIKDYAALFDGAHVYECLLFALEQENDGKKLSPEEIRKAKEYSRTKDCGEKYKKACSDFRDEFREGALLELKTFMFREIKVGNASATILYDADELDESGKIIHASNLLKLRKTGGAWKIVEVVSKQKK